MSEKDSKMDEKLAIPYKQAEEDDRLPMEVNKEASANENEEKVPELKLLSSNLLHLFVLLSSRRKKGWIAFYDDFINKSHQCLFFVSDNGSFSTYFFIDINDMRTITLKQIRRTLFRVQY